MEAWAQLVSTTDIESEPILITKQKFVIGRAQGADLCLANNKLVSGHHCLIEQDSSGRVWLEDVSTNGTLLNEKTKVAGQRVALNHGDEIFIVYRKVETDWNVSFLFQILEDLQQEQLDSTDEARSELDQTQPYEEFATQPLEELATQPLAEDMVEDMVEDMAGGRKTALERNKRTLSGKRSSSKSGSNDQEPVAKQPKCMPTEINCDRDAGVVVEKPLSCEKKSSLNPELDSKTNVSLAPDVTSFSSPSSDEKKPESVAEVMAQSSDEKPSGEKKPAEVGSSTSRKPDELFTLMEEELVCSICQDILHNSISLQPCLHTFCAGCYSEWMTKSHSCPSCRRRVKLISKNHKTNNIVEAYLTAHPEKRRSDDDLKELDAKNLIVKEMMEPPAPQDPIEEEDDEEEDEDDEEELGADAPDGNRFIGPQQFPFPYPMANVSMVTGYPYYGVPNVIRPPKTVCRQCPEYRGPNPAGGSTVGAACTSRAGPSAAAVSAAKNFPVPPPFVCAANQNHLMCLCCYQPMPDRRQERNWGATPNPIPAQECILCHKAFCHLYWGCFASCDGCLNTFEATVFRPEVLDIIVLKNKYESSALRMYLESNGLTLNDLFRSCLQKLKSGEYTCSCQDLILRNDSAVCYVCALDRFSELAYQFRRDIPGDDLPAAFRGRTNCHWGRNCTTQRNNEKHAQIYNHVCEASRAGVRL